MLQQELSDVYKVPRCQLDWSPVEDWNNYCSSLPLELQTDNGVGGDEDEVNKGKQGYYHNLIFDR